MRVENRKVGEGREVRDKKVDIAEGKKNKSLLDWNLTTSFEHRCPQNLPLADHFQTKYTPIIS